MPVQTMEQITAAINDAKKNNLMQLPKVVSIIS
jgi:hypothetical protein